MNDEQYSTELIEQLIKLFQHNLGDRGAVRETLLQSLTVSEIKDLAFDVNIDYEDLPGETKSGLLRELILTCLREGRLRELFRDILERHPHVRSKLIDADIVNGFGDVLAKDDYARMTLERSLAEPFDDHRTRALAGVITEAISKDQALLDLLNDLGDSSGHYGDVINQELKIDNAIGNDIIQIGKIVNSDKEGQKKNKPRKWLFF